MTWCVAFRFAFGCLGVIVFRSAGLLPAGPGKGIVCACVCDFAAGYPLCVCRELVLFLPFLSYLCKHGRLGRLDGFPFKPVLSLRVGCR